MPILPAGSHVSKDGRPVSLTDEHLQQIADGYDRSLSEAPIVIGHPKTNGPAYGWIESVFAKDGNLYGTPIQVAPEFVEGVKAGHWKKRSASLYPPEHPANPTPGKWYLRHVGFLGAKAPSIKGMPDYEFDEPAEGLAVIEFDENTGLWANILRNLRDFIIEKWGTTQADQVIPRYLLDTTTPEFAEHEHHEEHTTMTTNTLGRVLERKIGAADAKRPEMIQRLADGAKTTVDRVNKIIAGSVALPSNDELACFAEALHCSADELKAALPEDFTAARADLDRREAKLARREREAKDAEAKRRRTEAHEFCEGLAKSGRLLPRHIEPVTEVLVAVADTAVEFAESKDADPQSQPAGEILRELLQSLPAQVNFSEKSGAGKGDALTHVEFAAPRGATVDTTSLELHRRAEAYRRQHPKVSYPDAVSAVTAH